MSLNQCQFIGNLGRDPELRSFPNGDKVANLRLAVSEKWRDKASGENKERTEWVTVAVFGPLAGICEQYLRKGARFSSAARCKPANGPTKTALRNTALRLCCKGRKRKCRCWTASLAATAGNPEATIRPRLVRLRSGRLIWTTRSRFDEQSPPSV